MYCSQSSEGLVCCAWWTVWRVTLQYPPTPNRVVEQLDINSSVGDGHTAGSHLGVNVILYLPTAGILLQQIV